MKQLTCEMCGSTDLMKQDGVFVCQSCGTKYSVEEAKKMMVEGTVDVTGSTVKVDTSGELANLYQIARRAKDDNNGENAAKYYDMVLMKDPTSWEASFYVVYFKAMECKIAQIQSAGISVANCIDTVLKLIKDYVSKIEKYDSTYTAPQENTGGCYIATAVYGSYDCPQVWTLRRFRDYTLAETWYGRTFIRTYYAISPTLVKWFGHTEWFKKMWKGRLDRMVANLNAEGVEDTPYVDQEW